ncbi:MAG TPA: hypothetical protein DHV31_03550, partial [Clostridiales bacterium]|nr:hypothetical protein [Clostridiales bacterium]
YFGMPHIIIPYIGIKSEKEMKKSQVLGISWIAVILVMASVVGIVGRKYLGDMFVGGGQKMIFVEMARQAFPAFIAGVIITAILAASMSTADSQLLASSSAFASDVYKTVIKKHAKDREVMWVGRIVVVVISLLAFGIAILGSGADPIVPAFSTIMTLVSAAWAAFGAAFGPVILLSLYNRRVNYKGATAGIITGFAVDILWMILFNLDYYDMTSLVYNTGLYEIIPGFIAGLVTMLVVSYLTDKPSEEVTSLYDKVRAAKSVEVDEDGVALVDGVPFEREEIAVAEEVVADADAESEE